MAYTIDLAGRVALVTGASSGLGSRFAQTLAAAGATVVLASRRRDALQAVQERIAQAGGRAFITAMDVTDPASIEAALADAQAQAGPIDILVNNSGVSTTQKLQDVTPQDWDFVLDTNLKGAFFVAQGVARQMIARAQAAGGALQGARIINVASMAGLRVLPMIGIYAVSKAGVVQMTRAMALEWGRFGINVNALCPGYIETEINRAHFQTEAGKKLIQMLPRKKVGQPEDLDGLIVLLASGASHFVNGAVIAADDGFGV
ncbi:short-chain dehydrogenase [Vandammella animalimorsus]|uniref:Short-chain dehydrogenase n=1 Tax=Vandammella animalimorsus TaxID=2029117 RepID=A0A2A2T3H5_9BURK|nr:SDR family oxidoreductase [Vandammella animalimorsus]PAT32839.1 short-chain dehydrogenase [Vandammella animalimorsus]PAX16000.1 short-chain dehydrogenase [Vandammella animalimorsus]PAX18135.1 short-chain dehydrogenase [Vandammella animalimorsus]